MLQMIFGLIKENTENLIHKAYTNLDFIIGGVSGATLGATVTDIDWAGETLHVMIAVVRTVMCAIAGVIAVRGIHWLWPDKNKKNESN